MNTTTRRRQFGLSPRATEKGSFLAKVYGLLSLSLALSGATVAAACFLGGKVAYQGKQLPVAIATAMDHPYLMAFGFLGLVLVSALVRFVRGLNVMALGAVSVFTGLFIAPLVYMTQLKANAGLTFSPQPVLHAFALASASFVGLTLYALISGRDFSAWGGILSIGLWVLIAAGILNIFFGATAFALAISSVAVVIFGAYILYDTSMMLQKGEDDAVGCALNLYLDFLNLFLNLLRLLSGSSKD